MKKVIKWREKKKGCVYLRPWVSASPKTAKTLFSVGIGFGNEDNTAEKY